MNKEKLQSLTRYAEELKNRLQSPVPQKHVNHPETYKQFLNRELQSVNAKIEAIRMDAGGTK